MGKFFALVVMTLFPCTFLIAQDSEKTVHFGVKTGVNVTHFNLKDVNDDKTKTRYNYFSMPMLLKFFFGNHWAIIAGPQFDFLIQGKESMNGQNFDVSDYLKDHDILASGGFDHWPCKCIVLSARYMKGFTDIDFRSNAVRYYQEGMQASIGLKF